MFTGLVQVCTAVDRIEDMAPGRRMWIRAEAVGRSAEIGDSVAVSGCCLTVVARDRDCLVFEAGPETISRTTLGRIAVGGRVNLERSLRLGDALGGHLVTGHVDAVGSLDARLDEGDWATLWFRMPAALARQMASKGSVAVDGVSLTLVAVEPRRFSVALIPHTLRVTTLGALAPGDAVNLETDLLAKYVERQLAWSSVASGRGAGAAASP
jgi:riboflavin synthase